MRSFVSAAVAAMLLAAFATNANAQSMSYELLFQPLGLERAVKVGGMDCLMTTPYDTHARCGTTRVDLKPCMYPAFEKGELVCKVASSEPPNPLTRTRH